MFCKKWGVAVVAVALLVVAAIAILMYGNRTEHYHELSWTGKRENIPLLSQKAKASGNYRAEYRMFKLARIHWEQGSERKVWEIGGSGSLTAYYQENTEQCHKHGVHATRHNYDSFGNSTRQECYGKDGQLALDSNGVAIYETEYDSHGNMTQQECYGKDGQLTLDSDGVAVWKFEHDSYGNLLRLECYGVDGQLALSSFGFAIIESEYDSAGNETRREHYGVDGRLITLASNGVAIVESEYDSAGNVIAFRAYDAQGRLLEQLMKAPVSAPTAAAELEPTTTAPTN